MINSSVKEAILMDNNAIVISLVNAKGGVGKTTISTNISHVLATAGYKVLHVDLDPQGSSSELIKPQFNDGSHLKKDDIISLDIFKILSQPVDVRSYIFKTSYDNLYIIPNARSATDTYTNGSFDKRMERLQYANKYTAFSSNLNQIRGEFDYIIIDGQPGMNDIMKICIIASDYVLSPASPDLYNLHTVDDTCNIIDLCNKEYNRNIQYLGFFLNSVNDVKDASYKEVRDFYLKRSKEYFIDIPVRFSKAVNKSSSYRKLWLDYAFEHTITFPNPCRDLLKLMYKELMLLDDEHKEILIKQGVKKNFFE